MTFDESYPGVPLEVIEYAECFMQDYEYSDNLRICDPKNKESLQKYEENRGGTCCAALDYQKFNWNGKEYWFGFNYGH